MPLNILLVRAEELGMTLVPENGCSLYVAYQAGTLIIG